MAYVNLHSHSEYSNLTLRDSTNRLDKMMEYTWSLGQRGFALTDHAYVGNHVKAITTVEKLKAKGKLPEDYKVLLGDEIYLVDKEEMNSKVENKETVKFYHFILIAKDLEGHKQLQQISSKEWENSFTYKGIERRPTFYETIEEVVDSNPGHLIASTACLGGFLANKILEENYDSALGFIEWCQDVFGEDNFFLEMQPHKRELDEQGNIITSEQEIVNRWIYSQGIPAIITTDAHYLKESDKQVHSAYLKSDEDDETYSSGGRETESFYATTYFMSEQEIKEKLYYLPTSYIEQCFANTVDVWNRCEVYDLAQHVTIPQIPIPEEWYYNREVYQFVMEHDYQYIDAMLNSNNEYDEYLMYLAFNGLYERVPKEEWDITLKQLDVEMKELIGISEAKDAVVSSYFINTHKMLDIFWNEAECMTGCSRGSAAGWVLNYLLQIAHQNPLKQPMEMPHWRFISAERPDYPKL